MREKQIFKRVQVELHKEVIQLLTFVVPPHRLYPSQPVLSFESFHTTFCWVQSIPLNKGENKFNSQRYQHS